MNTCYFCKWWASSQNVYALNQSPLDVLHYSIQRYLWKPKTIFYKEWYFTQCLLNFVKTLELCITCTKHWLYAFCDKTSNITHTLLLVILPCSSNLLGVYWGADIAVSRASGYHVDEWSSIPSSSKIFSLPVHPAVNG